MNTQHNIEERLWNFIDGTVSIDEKSVIQQLLQNDAEWKAKYNELLQINELLQSSELEAPSFRFSKNVMEQIGKLYIAPATKSYINKKIIWGIGFFFIAMLIGFLIYGFGQMSLTTGEESVISKNISKFDLSRCFSNTGVNAFMLISGVTGLVLLVIYLGIKRKQLRKQL